LTGPLFSEPQPDRVEKQAQAHSKLIIIFFIESHHSRMFHRWKDSRLVEVIDLTAVA
jgi:hypothetical protein